MSGLAVGGKEDDFKLVPPQYGAQSFRELAHMEIEYIGRQSTWLYAFASGMVDMAPAAAEELKKQASRVGDEWQAAQRRYDALAVTYGLDTEGSKK